MAKSDHILKLIPFIGDLLDESITDVSTKKIVFHIIIIILFTLIYWVLGLIGTIEITFGKNKNGDTPKKHKIKNSKNTLWNTGKALSLYEAYHFALTTHTTVGFGDIYPTNYWSRAFAHIHMMCVFAANFL